MAGKTAANRSCRRVTCHHLNGHKFLTYKTSKFLDSTCLQNVTTKVDFSHIKSEKMPDFEPKTKFFVSSTSSMHYSKRKSLASGESKVSEKAAASPISPTVVLVPSILLEVCRSN